MARFAQHPIRVNAVHPPPWPIDLYNIPMPWPCRSHVAHFTLHGILNFHVMNVRNQRSFYRREDMYVIEQKNLRLKFNFALDKKSLQSSNVWFFYELSPGSNQEDYEFYGFMLRTIWILGPRFQKRDSISKHFFSV